MSLVNLMDHLYPASYEIMTVITHNTSFRRLQRHRHCRFRIVCNVLNCHRREGALYLIVSPLSLASLRSDEWDVDQRQFLSATFY